MGWSLRPSYQVLALLVGVLASLFLSSLLPVVFVVILIGFDLSLALGQFVKSSTLLRTAVTPAIVEKYAFSLTVDDEGLARSLNLTAAERDFLKLEQTRPLGFVLENWGKFLRWRVSFCRAGGLDEWSVDWDSLGRPCQAATLSLWEARLGETRDAPSIRFDWVEGDRRELRFYAVDGRFGGTYLPDRFQPDAQHTLLRICCPMPRWGDENNSVAPYLVESDLRMPGYDKYRGSMPGFRWWLERWDYRYVLVATVLRIAEDGAAILIKLDDGGYRLWARHEVVEIDAAGRALPHPKERIKVVLGPDNQVERIWPFDHFYLPAK